MEDKFEIRKAIIKIALEDYILALKNTVGYIDGSDCSLEPETNLVDIYFSREDAEKWIDRTVRLMIYDNNVLIEYEYIAGDETVSFDTVWFMNSNKRYPIDGTLYSEECYNDIVKYLA